jgi:solute carrier family 25 carnitine/acylcarnitine transporter 20/29
MDCIMRTFRTEGLRGFYKGVSSPLTGVPWMYTLSFGSWGVAQKLVEEAPGVPLSIPRIGIAGLLSGFATTVVTTPVELLKVRLQTQYATGTIKYRGLLDCALKTYAEEGLRKGLYRGFGATLLRDGPGSLFYYGAYTLVRRAFVPAGGTEADVGTLATLFSGGMGGVIAWLTCIQFDAVKNRIQHDTAGKYKGIADCISKTLAEGGVRSFYLGLGPVIVRAFFADACCFYAFELAMKQLKKYDP